MEVHKIFCDMCKKEIDINRENRYTLEIANPKSYIKKVGRYDLCEECKKELKLLLDGEEYDYFGPK